MSGYDAHEKVIRKITNKIKRIKLSDVFVFLPNGH